MTVLGDGILNEQFDHYQEHEDNHVDWDDAGNNHNLVMELDSNNGIDEHRIGGGESDLSNDDILAGAGLADLDAALGGKSNSFGEAIGGEGVVGDIEGHDDLQPNVALQTISEDEGSLTPRKSTSKPNRTTGRTSNQTRNQRHNQSRSFSELEDDSSHLVFSPSSLPHILRIIFLTYPPQALPLSRRTLPANVVYLFAKFAVTRCRPEELADLMDQTVESIEKAMHANKNSLPHLAFYLYNTIVINALVRSDAGIYAFCEECETMKLLENMLNILQVHITRLVESKIDQVIDSAILEHDPIPDQGSDDVRYEDEWKIFRSLTSRTKKKSTPVASPAHIADIFSQPAFSSVQSPVTGNFRPSSSTLGKSSLGSPSVISPSLTKLIETSPMDLESGNNIIISILQGTLTVLQIYEVHPCFVIQMFSQIFLWMASETFNRILKNEKKYLCRSKAVQIRMNLESISEWVRTSVLPPGVFGKHFEKVTQLLQWLQCSSRLSDLDMLLSTVSQMKKLNPLQLRRAVRDYRYEVNEPRMTEECSTYLAQLQRDWERRALNIGSDYLVAKIRKRTSVSSSLNSSTLEAEADLHTPIDQLFDLDFPLASYTPPTGPTSMGEFENSRYMLPLELPHDRYFSAVPPRRAAWEGAMPTLARLRGTYHESPRETEESLNSVSSSRPLRYRLRSLEKIQKLPDNFVDWFKASQTEVEALLLIQQETDTTLQQSNDSPSANNAKASISRWKTTLGLGDSQLSPVPKRVTPLHAISSSPAMAMGSVLRHPRRKPENLDLFPPKRPVDNYAYGDHHMTSSAPPNRYQHDIDDDTALIDPYATKVDDFQLRHAKNTPSWWKKGTDDVIKSRKVSEAYSADGTEGGVVSDRDEEQEQEEKREVDHGKCT